MTLADQLSDSLRPPAKPVKMDGRDDLPRWFAEYLRKRRETLIMELGEIEEILGMERSIVPRRKRASVP